VLKYITNRLFFPTASSVWHFPDALHFTMSLLQLPEEHRQHEQKRQVVDIKYCIPKSALKFQIYKKISVAQTFCCFYVVIVSMGITSRTKLLDN